MSQNTKKEKEKEKEKELRKYYLLAVPFLVAILILQLMIKLNNIQLFYIIIGFIWPYTFKAPGFTEKIINDKNKYSFLNITLKFFNFIYKLLKIFKMKSLLISFIKDILPSISFILILSSVIDFNFWYFVLIGNIFYLLFVIFQNSLVKRSSNV